uniref:Pecanex-like protein n=1 Tax=Ascaris lumbricoides TaxID=6252 RepID=A0A0M3ISV7_ASCLU
ESAAPSTRRVSPSRRDVNSRIQDTSRVPPIQGSSFPSAYHRCPRETTFGIDEDGTWQSVHNMIVNGNAQACTSASIHHRTSNGHVTTNGFRKSALLNGSPSNTLNGFVNGSTVNRFVPNGSVGSSPLRIHSPRGTSSCASVTHVDLLFTSPLNDPEYIAVIRALKMRAVMFGIGYL